MDKIRTFLSESLDNEVTESKNLKHSKKMPSSCTDFIVSLTSKIYVALMAVLRNYTHKSFIVVFTISFIFLLCVIAEFVRLIMTDRNKPEIIVFYYLGLFLALYVLVLSSFLIFLFWKVVQYALCQTTWQYNVLRLLFVVVDVITVVKWLSTIQARRDGTNYILMASYIKAAALSLSALFFLMHRVFSQCKKERFPSLVKLNLSVVIFLLLSLIKMSAFRHHRVSWEATSTVCLLFFVFFVIFVMLFVRGSKEECGFFTQIKITVLMITLYVLMISLLFTAHMDCNTCCGKDDQLELPSTHLTIIKNLDIPRGSDSVTPQLNNKNVCKINVINETRTNTDQNERRFSDNYPRPQTIISGRQVIQN